MTCKFITPNWPAPSNVQTLQTTRIGGHSLAPYNSFNLGAHVNDNTEHVALNRAQLNKHTPNEPLWLAQTHSNIALAADHITNTPEADASFSHVPKQVCVIMTADCLPLLLCDQSGTCVAAIHAGWKGLAAGIIENTIQKMNCSPSELLCWLGPAIGPNSFEVGNEVYQQFTNHHTDAKKAFKLAQKTGKWLANLYLLAQQRLIMCGVTPPHIFGGEYDTMQQNELFFSYRREQKTGRMASLIWLTK